MIRKNIDGRPIYSDDIWYKMLEAGKVLLKIGYIEAQYKPNLFYKKISKDDGDYEMIFADLRGDSITPIWEYLRISLYLQSKNNKEGNYYNEIDLWFHEIYLKRIFTIPIEVSSYWYPEELNGFCKDCNADILSQKDLSISQNAQGLDSEIELYYCDTCKILRYEEKRIARLCFLCKEREWTLEHHITYEPENIILVCNKCHSGKDGIHMRGFPNSLWKQKRSDFMEMKRKRREKFEAKKHFIQFLCDECGEVKFTIKKSCKCPNCGKHMKIIDFLYSNFHCSNCLKSWKGVAYQDYCIDCAIQYSPEMNEEDKKILKFNIQTMEHLEQREKYKKLYNVNTEI